jgi:exodeoxyribonuclease VII small subunit
MGSYTLMQDDSTLVPDPSAAPEAQGLEFRLHRLEAIVQRLERGEIPLEEALILFEEGVLHVREAETLLARAELRVEELVGQGEDAAPVPFPPEEDGGP